MFSKKFEKKSEELKIHEEKTLDYAKKYFKSSINTLSELGLVLSVELLYSYSDKDELFCDRPEFKLGYMGALCVQIRKESDSVDENLIAITFGYTITYILRSFLFGKLKFGRYPLEMMDSFFKKIDQTVDEVLMKGYDNVLKEVMNKNNS